MPTDACIGKINIPDSNYILVFLENFITLAYLLRPYQDTHYAIEVIFVRIMT